MQCIILLPLVFAWSVRSNPVSDANDLIDASLLPGMHNLVKSTAALYPWARLAPFRFKVYSTGITNIDLRAHVVWAGLKNFETAVRRVGDCTTREVYGNTTITCTLAFDGVEAYLNVRARGDSIFDILKIVEVEASMHDTTALFEVTTAPDAVAHVRTFELESVNFRIWPDEEELDLNSSRMRSFKLFIAQKLTKEFSRKVYSHYRRLLNQACSRINFSLAS
ncbi:salivary anticoagulant protein P23-like [Haemaphysalis longicornis]